MSSFEDKYIEYTWIAIPRNWPDDKTLKQIINEITKDRTIVLKSGFNMKLVWKNKESDVKGQLKFTVITDHSAGKVMSHAREIWFHATRWNSLVAESKFSYKKFSL